MEKKSILDKINSKYILSLIFDYIKYNNKIKLKLFNHSKKYQKMFELELIDYQERHFFSKMSLSKYLVNYNYNHQGNDDINILNKKLDTDLIKYKNIYTKEIIENIIIYIFKKRYKSFLKDFDENDEYNKINSLNRYKIEIYSPFLISLSKEKFFEQLFTILINLEELEKIDFKKKYSSAFDDLNKLKSKYTSLILDFKDTTKRNYLTEINIDYSNIKKIVLNNDKCSFIEILLSFDSIINNLIFLEINYSNYSSIYIKPEDMINLNDLKSLKILNLINVSFKEDFKIKNLSSLISLKLDKCNNISFNENSCKNIKILDISESKLDYSNSLIEFPYLEKCMLGLFDYYSNKPQNIHYYINFNFMEKLEYFKGEIMTFCHIKNAPSLKKVDLFSPNKSSDFLIFEKLIKFKTLEDIDLHLYDFNQYTNLEKLGENNSVTNLDLSLFMVKDNENTSILTPLLNIFPNLSKLTISAKYFQKYTFSGKNILEIEENPNCKINIFKLYLIDFNHIKLYCCPFDNLIEVEIYCHEIKNIKSCFPIFNDKCNVIFKSLKSFSFSIDEINIDVFNNIFNNIDCMPNLKTFYIKVIVDIEEDYYKKLIHKVLSLNLYDFSFILNFLDECEDNKKKKKSELKEMFTDIDLRKFNKIKISKFQSYIFFLTGEEKKYENLKYNYIPNDNKDDNKVINKKKEKKCEII